MEEIVIVEPCPMRIVFPLPQIIDDAPPEVGDLAEHVATNKMRWS